MSLRGSIIVAAIALAALVWADNRGMRPRPTPNDYPARQTVDGVTLAAAVLTPEQVKRRFATDLNRGYLVVEVAVFPEPGHDIEMATRDFLARFGSDPDTERPLSTQVIAARLGKKDPGPPSTPDALSKVHVYTEETVGVYKGANGRGGVYTGTTTGVGVGNTPTPPPPARSSGMTHTDVQQELDSMALPEGKLSEEVAGYLYFAKPAKPKSTLNLTYYGSQGRVELALPMK
jgi:hypothetical protein